MTASFFARVIVVPTKPSVRVRADLLFFLLAGNGYLVSVLHRLEKLFGVCNAPLLDGRVSFKVESFLRNSLLEYDSVKLKEGRWMLRTYELVYVFLPFLHTVLSHC